MPDEIIERMRRDGLDDPDGLAAEQDTRRRVG